jgi:putative FmdB family regulatory protein
MPTYDYVCDACDHEFELFQSITEAVKRKCPKCKKPKLRRLFGTGAAVMFEGSGFYTTDYRSESYKKRASEDKPASTNGEAKTGGDSKSESKPPAKQSSDATPKSKSKTAKHE